jgi:serine/threonine-protein kinase
MEWLEGESLSARLTKGAMPPREAIDVLDAMCDALEAAHEKGVIHRDLKSDNVFIVPVRKEKRVKLLDFGLAKLDTSRNDPDSIHKTKDGIIVGTPAYMSPEQARGKSVDHRTDIYALGCLAYKMVTAKLPFNADNAMDLIVKQLNDAPPSPAKLAPRTPAPLSRVIQRMMSKAPEDRPTLAEIRKVLAELRAPTAAEQPKKPRALSVLIGFLLFLCGVITLGVIGLIKQRDDAPHAPAASSPAPVPSQPAAGAAQATPPTTTPPAVIEFEEDKVGAAKPKAPTTAATPASGTATTPTKTAAGNAAAVAQPEDHVEKPRPGRVLLMLQRSSQIELDGRTMSADSKGGTFEVLAGSHTVRITAPGRQPITRTVDVEAGGTAVLRIDDDTPQTGTPAPPPTPAPTPAPVDKPADKPVTKPADTHKPDDGVFDPSTGSVVPQD